MSIAQIDGDSRSNTPVDVSATLIHPVIDITKSVFNRAIRTIAPLGARIFVNMCIENTSLSVSLKSYLTLTITGAQCIYDSFRLGMYTTKNYACNPSESNWNWAARNIGKVASTVIFLCGALDLARGSFALAQVMKGQPEIGIVWEVPGSQDDCSGSCNPEKVKETFEKLNQRVSPHVSFDRHRLDPDQITGGTCSAMSLACADEVFQARCIERQSTSCIEEIVRKKFSKSGQSFRDVQAAFNAITVHPEAAGSMDPRKLIREKMAALSSLYQFQIVSECDITNTAQKLADGIYLGRAISSANNHKKEYFGHTIMFFKIGEEGVLYNPSRGGKCFSSIGLEATLKKTCKRAMEVYSLPEASFFQIARIVL